MQPLAVFVSDLHLQARVPRARAEESWFDVMRERLKLLEDTAQGAPIFCAGDVFDHWAPGPELINFAIEHLPLMWSIPGQHDLPGHNYEGRSRGAYHTLELAGCIFDMPPGRLPLGNMPPSVLAAGVRVYTAPWGFELPEPEPEDKDKFKILIAHRYVATGEDTAYPGAPPSSFLVGGVARACEKYDLAVFGDNHKGFTTKLRGCTVMNHGAFIPRASDEMDYRPQVGVLYQNLEFKVERLIPKASWRTAPADLGETKRSGQGAEYTDYIKSCRNLREPPVPFLDRLKLIADSVGGGVGDVIRRVRESCGGDNKQSI